MTELVHLICDHIVSRTFPGMIDEPGSFSGRESSPMPDRGPDPRNRMSFAICGFPRSRNCERGEPDINISKTAGGSLCN